MQVSLLYQKIHYLPENITTLGNFIIYWWIKFCDCFVYFFEQILQCQRKVTICASNASIPFTTRLFKSANRPWINIFFLRFQRITPAILIQLYRDLQMKFKPWSYWCTWLKSGTYINNIWRLILVHLTTIIQDKSAVKWHIFRAKFSLIDLRKFHVILLFLTLFRWYLFKAMKRYFMTKASNTTNIFSSFWVLVVYVWKTECYQFVIVNVQTFQVNHGRKLPEKYFTAFNIAAVCLHIYWLPHTPLFWHNSYCLILNFLVSKVS